MQVPNGSPTVSCSHSLVLLHDGRGRHLHGLHSAPRSGLPLQGDALLVVQRR